MYRLYKHIELLPLFNWIQVLKNNDLRYLIVLEDYNELPKVEDQSILESNWDNIQSQIIDLVGISESTLYILERQKEIVRLRLEMFETGDIGNMPFINKYLKELHKYTAQNTVVNWEEKIAEVELFFKFQIDIQKTSVSRFLTYLKIMQRNGRKSDHK